MEYRPQPEAVKVTPRLIIHGGAGNISRESMTRDRYQAYRSALLTIVSTTDKYMRTPLSSNINYDYPTPKSPNKYPSALEIATYAVTQLENNPLFNSGHGAVFTRDGINELEASVMVSRGFAKRGVGVTGLRHVKNPILLAKAMLEHGDEDLGGKTDLGWTRGEDRSTENPEGGLGEEGIDAPSAQGHTLLHGETAETLAKMYGMEMVEPKYYFTQRRWDEHLRTLKKERDGKGKATWSAEEYLPQGTCGAVALDENGVLCVATSTGGMTNKLTGRIGDTPVVGAGFWAEEWAEEGDPSGSKMQKPAGPWHSMREYLDILGPTIELSSALRSLLADCLPTPFSYTPISTIQQGTSRSAARPFNQGLKTTRSAAMSGTGNGDSFLRIAAVRSVASIARWGGLPTVHALNRIAGRGGELEQSAGERWGRAGEGEGGMIGIESVVSRDASGQVVGVRSEILQDHNCAGMFRAWINDDGEAVMRIWHPDDSRILDVEPRLFAGEDRAEDVRCWSAGKA